MEAMPFQHGVYNTKKISVTGAKMCLGERKERRPGRNVGLEDCTTCVRELYSFLRALASCFKHGGGGKWREMGDSLQ